MARCLYNSTIREFLQLSPEALLGRFVNNYHGAALTTTNEAWNNEIRIMQEVLHPWMDEGRRAGHASIQHRTGPGLCP